MKAAVMAAEAATTPAPPPAGSTDAARAQTSDAARTGSRAGATAARTTAQVSQTRAGVARGTRRFGEAVWGPLSRLSGVLWLEVMGVFFGLFVLTAAMNVWKLRASWQDTPANHTAHQHLLFSVAMLLVFGYFCVSSFVRAGRRGRSSR